MEKEKIQEKLFEMQKLYSTLKNDLKYMNEFEDKFSSIQSKMDELVKFYEEDWMNYVDYIEKDEMLLKIHDNSVRDEEYNILSQDTIWNLFTDYEETKKHILKRIVNSL